MLCMFVCVVFFSLFMVHALQTTRVWTSIVTPPSPSPIFYFHSYIQFFSYQVLFYSQSSAVWFVFTAPRIWKKKTNLFIADNVLSMHGIQARTHTHTHSKYNHKTLFVRNWFRWVGGSHSAHAAILLHCMHAALWSISAFGKISFFFHFASISSNERQRSLWLNHTWQRTLKSFCAQLTKLFCQLQLYLSQQLLYRHIHSALMDMCIGRKKNISDYSEKRMSANATYSYQFIDACLCARSSLNCPIGFNSLETGWVGASLHSLRFVHSHELDGIGHSRRNVWKKY